MVLEWVYIEGLLADKYNIDLVCPLFELNKTDIGDVPVPALS
jgi:hypothetical protein